MMKQPNFHEIFYYHYYFGLISVQMVKIYYGTMEKDSINLNSVLIKTVFTFVFFFCRFWQMRKCFGKTLFLMKEAIKINILKTMR